MTTRELDAGSLTWAHLSDFHFATDKDWARDEVVQGLLRDLAMFAGKSEPARGAEALGLDLILVTGDVAYSGKRDEYDRARAFFDRLASETGVDRARIFVVPGNHDIDRRQALPPAMRPDLGERKAFEEVWGSAPGRRGLFASKLAAYREFAEKLNPALRFPEEHPGGFFATAEIRGKKIALWLAWVRRG